MVLVDRANYGRLKPVMHAIADRPELDLQVICSGTMVLERFHQPVNVVREDGFRVDGEVYMELEGSTPTTMAKSVGFGMRGVLQRVSAAQAGRGADHRRPLRGAGRHDRPQPT